MGEYSEYDRCLQVHGQIVCTGFYLFSEMNRSRAAVGFLME